MDLACQPSSPDNVLELLALHIISANYMQRNLSTIPVAMGWELVAVK